VSTPQPPIPEATFAGPLPRNWELAYGYRREDPRRWLSAYWQPAGDEARMDDGEMDCDGNWVYFLHLVDGSLRLEIVAALGSPRGRYALGSSDNPPTHCLLCDLQERHVYVAPIAAAERFLIEQVAQERGESATLAPTLSEEEWQAFLQTIYTEVAATREERASMALAICHACLHGYVEAEDGYDPCPTCQGENTRWVSVEEAEQLNRRGDVAIVWPSSYLR
jgi:hypothetical protein